MTKAALRRQERERQAQQGTDRLIQQQPEPHGLQDSSGYRITEQPRAIIPHMEPPPPYDAPHLSHGTQDVYERSPGDSEDSACLSFGPGESEGCLNYNSDERGQLKVQGCLNYDSSEGCCNYRSKDGCCNWESKDGCCLYRSSDGCMNWESDGGGCLNFRSSKPGCCLFNRR